MPRTYLSSRLFFRVVLPLALAFATPLVPRAALADDLADEADLQFQLGTEAYAKSDFRGALEHFLVSNRLVPNKNVVFNIARTFEQLRQFPDAYRYYNLALEGENDPAARVRVEDAVRRIAPNVAVVKIATDPPGATVYVDRKDLGPRGTTPRTLGLPAGKYTLIIEKPGFYLAQSSVDIRNGTETPVSFKLTQILGTVHIEGAPPGADIRVELPEGPVACVAPCDLRVPPGRHDVVVTREGFQTADAIVDVVANETVVVKPKATPLTGSVVVSTDVRDALIEIDGRPMGFSPSVLTLPVGPHALRLSLGGFRPIDRAIVVRSNDQVKVEGQLTQVEQVNAASRAVENVEDAPSSVSIISGPELRAMGYPTIAEAVRGVRGMYVTGDSSYTFVGARGLSRTSDYGNKVLILLDGHPLNDDVLGQSFTGFEGRTDLDDIDRIEIIRGPGSVLYGTGAFFAVINLVTRTREAPTHGEVGVSVVDQGVGRARLGTTIQLGNGAGFWLSAGVAKGRGADYYFHEYANSGPPDTTIDARGGRVNGAAGFETDTIQGRFWWKDFTVQWFFHQRQQHLASGEYDTILGDPRALYEDTRGLIEARYEPHLRTDLQLLSRAHANIYDFVDVLPYNATDGGPEHENYRGIWFGLEERLVYTPTTATRFTVGGEVQDHAQVYMHGHADDPTPYLKTNNPFVVAAGYGVADVTPSPLWKLSAGARYDYFSNTQVGSVDPRVAVIFRPTPVDNIKLMGGKAFRSPSNYELYYNDGGATQIASPNLTPEQVYSGELEYSHRLSNTLVALGTVFTNYITHLVVPVGNGDMESPLHYTNSVDPVLTVGGEAELRRDWRDGWMVAAQYSYQHTQYLQTAAEKATNPLRDVPNSPQQMASFKGAVPILPRTLLVMSRLTLETLREDRYDQKFNSDGTLAPAQGHTGASAIWDVVLSGQTDRYGVSYAFGIYNAFDYRYTVPVSAEFRQVTMPQPGRTVLASLSARF